jgi:hypothetical protein
MKKGESLTHLARGAECVRSWSKYQKTDFGWHLCGTEHYSGNDSRARPGPGCVAEPSTVKLPLLRRIDASWELLRAATPCSFCATASAAKLEESAA